MSARDRYSIDLRCALCGSVGSADLPENDHAYGPPKTRIDAVHGGFQTLQTIGMAATPQFCCILCGVEAT